MMFMNIKRFLDISKKTEDNRGIALLVALGTMIVILIIGSLSIYLITRGVRVTGGQTRYETAYEAAVASLEIGKARAEYLSQQPGIMDTTEIIRIGNYNTEILVERTSTSSIVASGTAMKFARAIAGPGATPSYGSYRTYYIQAHAQSASRTNEQVMLEILQRYTVFSD